MESARLRARFLGRRSLLIAATLAALLAVPLPTSAATITGSWQAKLGSGGANGTASVVSYLTGTGSVTLKLVKLKPATLLPVAIYKGTCSAVGAKVVGLASIKTTSKGAATRTSALTAAQTKAMTTAAAAGKLTIRVGSGSAVKCGAFAARAIAPYVAATITLGTFPYFAALDNTTLWATNLVSRSISKVDVTSNTVALTVPWTTDGAPGGIVSAEGALWVTSIVADGAGGLLPSMLVRLDPASASVTATIPVGRGAIGIAASPGAVWVANYGEGTVSRVDTATNAVVATIPVGTKPSLLAYGAGAVWVTSEGQATVTRIDAATNQVAATITLPHTSEGVAVDGSRVWVSMPGTATFADGGVVLIDPATNTIKATYSAGYNPGSIAVAGGRIWVAMLGEPNIVSLSESTGAVLSRTVIGAVSTAIVATGHTVWALQPHSAISDPSTATPGTVARISY